MLSIFVYRENRMFGNRWVLARALVVVGWLSAMGGAGFAGPPVEFQDQFVLAAEVPISLAFLPDERMLVLEKSGRILLADPREIPVVASEVLWLENLDSGGERGLLDITLDPSFASNGFFYVYSTAASPARIRVSRFTLVGDVSSLASEVVVYEAPEDYEGCCHYGGGLDFGPDGNLYLTVGDQFFVQDPGTVSAVAQDLSRIPGSVLRLAPDGSIPPDNPFVGVEGALDEIWAFGLRNPFRARWDLPTERFFLGDVGGNVQEIAQEEINLGVAGANYGWPDCEGPSDNPEYPDCDPAANTDPLFSYPHRSSQGAVAAGFVYRGDSFPEVYHEVFFYGDFAHGEIRYLTFDGSGAEVTGDFEFDPAVGPVIFLTQGPGGELYYTTFSGEIRRVVYLDQAPTKPIVVAEPATGPAPLTVELSATSSDDQSPCLDYHFFFGDGAQESVECVPSGSAATATHTYLLPGPYTVQVLAFDGEQSSISEPLTIAAGIPPVAEILEPADGRLFRAGDVIDLRGLAADPDGLDEELTARWAILFLHNDHEHTAEGAIDGREGVFVIPDRGHDFHDETGYEVIFTVVDRDGLRDETSVILLPDKVDLWLETSPPGLRLEIDNLPVPTPRVYDTLIGFRHQVRAPVQCFDGLRYELVSWSDGGGATHEIVVPEMSSSLLATFTAVGPCLPQNGLALWLDAGSGVETTPDGGVVSWVDQSPFGNDVATLGGSPSRVSNGLNGEPVIEFDGLADALGRSFPIGLPAGNGDRSAFQVVRFRSTGSGGFAYGSTEDCGAFGLVVAQGSGHLGLQGWGAECDVHSQAPGAGAGWLRQGAVLEGGVLRHTRNGVVIDTRSPQWNTGSDRLRIGVELDDSPAIAMDVAEILVYDRALGEAERMQIEEYLEDKYFPGDNLPPETEVDAVAVRPGGEVLIDLLANDRDPDGDAEDHLHGHDVSIELPPRFGIVLGVDPETGELRYRHSGGPTGDDVFTYTVADHEGTRSTETAVYVRVLEEDFPTTEGLVLLAGSEHGAQLDEEGQVVRWLEHSGRGNHLSATGDPALGTTGGPEDRPFLRFDGGGDSLQRSGELHGLPGGNTDRTLFLVASYRSSDHAGFSYGSTDEGLGCTSQGNRAFGLVVDRPGKLTVQGWCAEADFHSEAQGTGRGWLVQSALLRSGRLHHFLDGVEIDGVDHGFATDVAGGRIVLGVELDGFPYADMDVAAVLVYDRALSPEERLEVEAFLQGKYLGVENASPVAVDDLAAVFSGQSVVVDVLLNDHDDRALDPRTLQVLDAPEHGTATVIGPTTGTILYTSNAGSTEPDSFTYAVADLAGNVSSPATVRLEVFDPSLPTEGLVLHLESAFGVETSTESVSFWRDLSSGGNHLRASGHPLLLGGGPAGRSFVYLDGTDDHLANAGPLVGLPGGSGDRSAFAVVRYHGNGFGGLAWGSIATSHESCAPEGNRVFGLVVDPGGDLAVQGWCPGNDFSTPSRAVGEGWLLHSVVLDGDQLRQYRDGVEIASDTHLFATDSGGRLVIGAEIDGNPPVPMDVAAFLVYDRVLSEADRSTVEQYLTEKYLGATGCRLPGVGDEARSVALGGMLEISLPAPVGECPALPTAVLIEAPIHGSVAFEPATSEWLYSHAGGSLEDDHFSYAVFDGLGQESGTVTVRLGILPQATGLVFHVDAANGVVAAADDVLAWIDLSGAANDLVATSSPKWVAEGPSGRPFVAFDGFGDRLSKTNGLLGLPAGNDDRTIVAVVRYRGEGFGGITYGTPACNRVFGLMVDNLGRLGVQGWCSDFRTDGSGTGAGWMVQSARLAGGVLEQFANGSSIDLASHTFDTDAMGALVLGGEIDGSPGVAMDVAAVLIFDRALEDEELRDLEDQLRDRFLSDGS